MQVQRELAQLSATLLPSHPRIKQLNSELADVREQIRDEAAKNVKGLKNEAEVASARETSLCNSLNDTKARDSGQGDAEIRLRALEREAKADRDLLESFLARYRDASARHDMGAVPAQAAIVSRAHASILPSSPQRGPLSLLIMVATALVALASLVARELLGAPASAAPQATTAATVVPAITAAAQAASSPGGAKSRRRPRTAQRREHVGVRASQGRDQDGRRASQSDAQSSRPRPAARTGCVRGLAARASPCAPRPLRPARHPAAQPRPPSLPEPAYRPGNAHACRGT